MSTTPSSPTPAGRSGVRASRRFLYWGVFLVAVGGVVVAADLRGVDVATLEQGLRFWPLAVIALGVAMVVRRSRFNAAAWVVGAVLPGLVLGSAFAIAPRITLACGMGEPAAHVQSQGAFEGPATIDVATGCGTLSVDTAAGSGWRLDAGSDNGAADVNATATSLTVRSGHTVGWFATGGRDVWRLTLPTAPIADLSLVVNAGDGTVNLAGAQITSLELQANAARASADLSTASVANLSATANAGSLALRLPGGRDLTGTLEVNAGQLKVCVPPGLGFQVTQSATLGSASYRGATQNGPIWQSADYGTAAHRADLTVRVTLGSIEFDPIGGCQ